MVSWDESLDIRVLCRVQRFMPIVAALFSTGPQKQGQLPDHTTCAVVQGPMLRRVYFWFNARSALAVLRFLILFGQGVLHFHLSLGP